MLFRCNYKIDSVGYAIGGCLAAGFCTEVVIERFLFVPRFY